MAWEKRHQKTYYYHKIRQGDRVISQYLGSGPKVEEAVNRRRRHRQEEQQLRHDLTTLDASLTQLYTLIHTLRRASLLLTGHHTHKGQWRKKRAPPSPGSGAKEEAGR